MRLLTRTPHSSPLEFTDFQMAKLLAWIDREVEDACSARNPQELVWRDRLREYDAIPRQAVRNVPIENAPNIEIPVGAWLTDSIYAQVLDLIFNIQPILTARPINADAYPERKLQAEAIQDHINWGSVNEWGLRQAAEEVILDCVKLGTGVYQIPFVEDKKKTRTATTVFRGPRILPLPIEDFFVPGGAYGDLQRSKWTAKRTWMTVGELNDEAAAEDWNIDGVQAVGAIGWVRNRREMLGRTWRSNVYAELFEIWKLSCYFDVDGDGVEEDLLVVYDRTSRRILKVQYNGYDCRTEEAMRYQLRGHLFYGIGVMDMTAPFQQEASDVHSYALTNALLANARFWKAKNGSAPESMKVWAGKVVELNEPDDVKAEAMADIYPSMVVMQGFPIQMAQQRVGMNDVAMPNRGAMPRTPGITAISLLNQANKRFTPAFDAVRYATAGAVRQCLLREQERILAGDKTLEKHLIKIHGEEKGNAIIAAMRDKDFDQAFTIQLTASSTTLNRDVERQNAILLVNILGQYYQRVLELVAISSNPQTPPAVADAARKIADAAGEIVGRTIRTFDQIRDPSTFIVDVNDELDKATDVSQQGMQMLMQLFAGMAGTSANGAGATAGPVSVG